MSMNRNVEIKAKPILQDPDQLRPRKAVGFGTSVALRSYDCVNYGVLAGLLSAHPNASYSRQSSQWQNEACSSTHCATSVQRAINAV